MNSRTSKQILIAVFALAVINIAVLVVTKKSNEAPVAEAPQKAIETVSHKVIGKSVEGRNIDAYVYGSGQTHLMFVGGIHGGYEWNSVLLAYQFMDYLKADPSFIPKNLTVAIIPSANPDGVFDVIGKDGRFTLADVPTKELPNGTGRFNAHNVDLNRNFDCKWRPKGVWKNKIVSAGTSAFSEPEAAAIRDFVEEFSPAGAIFWHSKANAVYASECEDGILTMTLDIMNVYARAGGYTPIKSFDSYEVNGDVEGWLASINIPAITVELQTHETVEWERNLAGIKALFGYYSF